MRKMSESAMMQANGGASKYVKCPSCGYNRKTTITERLFGRDDVIRGRLLAVHGYPKNLDRSPYDQSVHY